MKTARRTLVYAAVLAAPYLTIGLFSGGAYAPRVLRGGIFLLAVAGLASLWMAWRGNRIDSQQDERKDFIINQSMRFSFAVTSVALQAYWAWQFARLGNAGDSSFWLLVALWGSFLGAHAYNSLRH